MGIRRVLASTATLMMLLVALASKDMNQVHAFTLRPSILSSATLFHQYHPRPSTSRTASTSTTRLNYYNEAYIHYQVLGLTSNASKDEIKKAYRRLAKQYHPGKVVDVFTFLICRKVASLLGCVSSLLHNCYVRWFPTSSLNFRCQP